MKHSKKHKKSLTEKIIHLDADPTDEIPMMGMISEFFEKMKNHPEINDDIRQATSDLLHDYKIIFQKLSYYKTKELNDIHHNQGYCLISVKPKYQFFYKLLTHFS